MSGINIEKVDHIGVRVRDLDRSLAFYEVLGFSLPYASLSIRWRLSAMSTA